MITIILTLISLIIYDIGKKGLKILFIRWNKKKLETIINGIVDNTKMEKIDKNYWGEDKWT